VRRNEVTKTVPPAGETHPLDTPVVLYVASGQVDLPDLVGKPRAEALQILEGLGLNSTITEEESDAAPDSVIAQDRSPGQVPQSTSVGLTIAVAPTTVDIPGDVVGKTYDEAAAQLTALGLKPVRVDVESDEPEGQVISTEPGQGTTVDIGSDVTVNVAAPPPEENGDEEGDANAAADEPAPAEGAGNGNAGNGNGNGNAGSEGNGNGGRGNGDS